MSPSRKKPYRATRKHEKVKKIKKNSSRRWLERQINDPYVRKARTLGMRSRSAFKLLELNDKFNFIKPNHVMLDLGAAPGGWCQVIEQTLDKKSQTPKKLIAVDLLEMDSVPHMEAIQGDFTSEETQQRILDILEGEKIDLILSDMAPNTIGHAATDHLRILALTELAYDFALKFLKKGGHFVCKIFIGGQENELLKEMKAQFEKVSMVKPDSSRKESPEKYIVALGFKAKS